jgi:PAS domain S-box-containing protein
MNKFLNTVSLAMVLLALFSAFVISWEIRFSRIAVGQLREQAAIIANAVWNFDEEGALKYLQAAALISDYESITVFAVNADKPFIEVRGPEARFLETLFLRAGLISQKELRTSIMHKEKGTVIGWLQVVRWHKTVYVYGYLFLVMGLFLLAFKYFLQTVRAKATLEIAVGERTAELQKSRETLSLILNTVPQAVFWKDREGSYLGCNRVFAVIVGLNEPSQVVGKTDFGLPWTREEAEAYCAVDGDVIRNNRPEFHIIEQVQAASGRRLWVDTSKVPLCDAAGRPFAVLGVFEDITERKQAEAREKVLMAKLEQAGRMEALGMLAGGVAHDLNNVLGPIVVLPDMISGYIERHGSPDDPEYADVRQDVQILKTSALRAAAVVNDLVVMGRRSQFKKTLIDVNQVVRQAKRASFQPDLWRRVGVFHDAHVPALPGPGDLLPDSRRRRESHGGGRLVQRRAAPYRHPPFPGRAGWADPLRRRTHSGAAGGDGRIAGAVHSHRHRLGGRLRAVS